MAVQIPSTTVKWNDLFSRVSIRLDPEVLEQINSFSPTFTKFYETSDKSTGLPKLITKRVRYTHNTMSAFSGLQDINLSIDQKETVAIFTRAAYRTQITIPVDDLATYQSPESKVNYITEEYEDAIEGSKDMLGRTIFSGSLSSSPETLWGITATIKATSSTSGTYASLSRNTNSWWRNTATSNAGGIAGMTLSSWQDQWTAVSQGPDVPDLIVANQVPYNKFWAIADSKQREQHPWAAKLGFTSMQFNGVPVVLDKYCPTDRVFFINTKYFRMYVDKNFNFKTTPFIYVPHRSAMVKQIFFFAQTCCRSLRHQGVLYNLK